MDELNLADAREYIDSLPELKKEERFSFDCHPEVPCFNQCCAELTLPLTPYDIARLIRHTGLPSTQFLTTYTEMRTLEETGFPLFTLRMKMDPGEPCPFVSPVGCMVYEDRPSACRCYPLGRGTKLGPDGIIKRFFMVHEDHCHGFDEGTIRTPHEWMHNQGLDSYNEFNDRYMRLMALVQATEKPLDTRLQGMCRLCLFHLDQFRQMITKMRIFTHVTISEDDTRLIMQDDIKGDEACLNFAFDWMELVIFGKAERLQRK